MKTPGPGPKYVLPSLTGFDRHDPTRFRYPANTVSPRFPAAKMTTDAPAPKYTFDGYTRNGPAPKQAAFITGRWRDTYQITPGPGRYAPELHPDPRYKTAPSSSLGVRRSFMSEVNRTPGASKYMVPTTIGPNVPDKKAEPAYTMLGRSDKLPTSGKSPGPGRYGVSPIEAYKKRASAASILGPYQFRSAQKGVPGPKYMMQYNNKLDPPAYTFGVKHAWQQRIFYHPADTGMAL